MTCNQNDLFFRGITKHGESQLTGMRPMRMGKKINNGCKTNQKKLTFTAKFGTVAEAKT
jgi:hypothetical protein